AMIGQRLTRHLAPGDAATVGEGREENRVDVAALLDDVQDLIDDFVNERDGADLDADQFLSLRRGLCGFRGGRKRGGQDRASRADRGGGFQELTTPDGVLRLRQDGLAEDRRRENTRISLTKQPFEYKPPR